ncbi:AMP-binding protein [Embleya scabrispora]|uniref:AMP-binding protein n=1 Tax=Embleya scabrispora TaxID=159449 RepID=UPI000371EF2B|nr:AMP-binding protein [Embleya scabrispora]MYS82704.1 AMP-binding protein [Streptomyces sp. SID5474]
MPASGHRDSVREVTAAEARRRSADPEPPAVRATAPGSTVPGLLAARALVDPDRVAFLLPGTPESRLTFAEWDRRSSSLARELRARGVREGDRIGLIFAGREWADYAVAYCAVHRAGAVAVPLPERLPPAALHTMLTHCAATAVVHGAEIRPAPTDAWNSPAAELEAAAARAEGRTANPHRPDPHGPDPHGSDPHGSDPHGSDPHRPNQRRPEQHRNPSRSPSGLPASRPDDLAQILYTSGTTGTPKGVAATHANLTHGFEPTPRHRQLAHSRHFLHAFPIGTNAGQTMLLNALTAEPTALCAPTFDAEEFCALIAAYRVGTVFTVPAMATELVNSRAWTRHDVSTVQLFGSTAAALPPATALALTEAFPDATIVNSYTSTEAAPAQTTMVFDADRPTSVGRGTGRDDLRIVGADGEPVPTGEVGEIWLRPPTASRTYYRDARADAEVFTGGWVRMGDIGRLDADGYLYLIDRESDLIKSGATRISTLAVEAALYEHPAVADASVFGLPHPVMGTMVAAALVLRAEVSAEDLRVFLGERLARHEIPTRLLRVDSLPRNPAGKVVKEQLRSRLAESDTPSTSVPRTATEVAVSGLWDEVLGSCGAGPDDNFFALGGDSFKATRLAAAVERLFALDVPSSLAFDRPELAAQAAWIDAARADPRPVRPGTSQPSAELAPMPLSSQQENFFVWMHATEETRDVGPVSVGIRITDTFDPDTLTAALAEIVRRHEALRTVFRYVDGAPEALVRPELRPEVRRVRAEGGTPAERERFAHEHARIEREQDWDLARGPLVRALLIELDAEDHVLIIAVHHMVFDGWSMGVLLRELALIYSAFRTGRPSPLTPPMPTCAEHLRWARAQWPRTRPFWEESLAGAPAAIDPFPGRDVTDRLHSASVRFTLDADLVGRLRTSAREQGATAFMLATACWTSVLARTAGTRDIVVMSPVPGRSRPGSENLIGCLVQSLLIRIDLRGDPSFGELLARVRSAALAANEHQSYPFAEFYPRFPDAAWIRYESWSNRAHFLGLVSEPFDLPRELDAEWSTPGGRPDLGVPELALAEQPDGTIAGWLLYNERAFAPSVVEGLAQAFVDAWALALDQPQAPVFGDVDALVHPPTATEKG